MKVVILAGGLGTRLQEETAVKPKPMVEIGGQPILWHIMKTYAHFGHKDFAVAMGYKSEVIRNYFLTYYYHHSNFTVHLKSGQVDIQDGYSDDWSVFLADTGVNTMTGGRLKQLQDWVNGETFMMTYGDGVSDIDIDELLAFHKKNKRIATITAVRPPSRFGGINIVEGHVDLFVEKPQIGEGWINGGFFVLEPEVFNYLQDDQTIFERGPLEKLAEEGQLMAYKHYQFWQCMDTIRDLQFLENLWVTGQAYWRKW